jgi:hypothetical protein
MVEVNGANGVGQGVGPASGWRKFALHSGSPIGPVHGPPTARVSINTTPGQLSIDSTQARREIGYRYLTELAYDRAAFSRQQAERGVADIVSAGDTLAVPRPGSIPIPQLAFERMLLDLRDLEFQLAFVPLTPPSISFTPGRVNIDFVY